MLVLRADLSQSMLLPDERVIRGTLCDAWTPGRSIFTPDDFAESTPFEWMLATSQAAALSDL